MAHNGRVIKSISAGPKKGPDAAVTASEAAAQSYTEYGSTYGDGPQIHASHKENPMSLGFLNNLSAVYAENYLTRAFLI